jgi:hypothetical protein
MWVCGKCQFGQTTPLGIKMKKRLFFTFLDELFSARKFWETFIRRNAIPPTVQQPLGGLLLPQSQLNQFLAIQISWAV